MQQDQTPLESVIERAGLQHKVIAQALGIGRAAATRKLRGRRGWEEREVKVLMGMIAKRLGRGEYRNISRYFDRVMLRPYHGHAYEYVPREANTTP